MLALAWIDPGKLVKVRDLPGDLHGKIAHIKARNSLHATLARKNCAAKLVFADPVRSRDDSVNDKIRCNFHFTRSPDGPITRFSRDPITRSYFFPRLL